MIRAAAAFAAPSTESCPAVFELSTPPVTLQPGDTTYHRGSPAASSNGSTPSVRHGKRPTAGSPQFAEASPSLAGLPILALASGQGSLPGWSLVLAVAVCAT